MSTIGAYEILHADTASHLESKVEEACCDGTWVPIGGPIIALINGDTWHQAVIMIGSINDA